MSKDREAFALYLRERRESAVLRDPLELAAAGVPRVFPPWKRAASSQAAYGKRDGLKARGFAFGYAWLGERLRTRHPECDGYEPKVIANDGTLCPTVIGEGAELTPTQLERLFALLRAPGTVTERWRCGYQPHHAFVIFDANDAPIAQIGVCFTCGEWRADPPIAGADDAMGKSLNEGLRAICRELGLGGCGYDLETNARVRNERVEQWQHRESRGDLSNEALYPLRSVPSGVEPDKRLDELSEGEKRRLCAFHVRRLGERGPGNAGEARMCSDTKTMRVLDFTACVEGFPRCAETVRDAEACVARTSFDTCNPQDCDDRCLVGVSRLPETDGARLAAGVNDQWSTELAETCGQRLELTPPVSCTQSFVPSS